MGRREQEVREQGDGLKRPVEIDIDLKHESATCNAKTELATFLSHKIGRSMEKQDDVSYTCEKTPKGWVATLVLECLDRETIVGEPKHNQKTAEQAAAKACLERYREEIEEHNREARPMVVPEKREKPQRPLKEGEPP